MYSETELEESLMKAHNGLYLDINDVNALLEYIEYLENRLDKIADVLNVDIDEVIEDNE